MSFFNYSHCHEGVQVQLCIFSVPKLGEEESQLYAPAALPPGKNHLLSFLQYAEQAEHPVGLDS